jgi:cytoskeletal protein RodZ
MPFVIRKLNDEQTLGAQLKAMRLELNLTLPEMERRTKIRKAFLVAIEKDAYDRLPEPLYTRNLLKTYVRVLGGDIDYVLDRFEEARGTCDFTDASRLPRQRARATAFFTPARFVKLALLTIASLGVVAYLGFQVRSITAPPDIALFEPTDGFTTDQAVVKITGQTTRNATVRVNGAEILLSKDGAFESEVALERGLNVITIEGAKRYSRPATIYRRVILKQEHAGVQNDFGG